MVNSHTTLLNSHNARILCLADIRGKLSALNDLAREHNAAAIIHTGDFGFFQANSLERINDRTLRHLTMYSPLIPAPQRTHLLAPENPPALIRSTVNIELLSEFPLLLSGQLTLSVPVYTVWGACEDVQVLEKFRSGAYSIPNLHVLDEATTRLLDIAGLKLRLFGLGGALVNHKLFDNGDGAATIAGGQGTMWTTALQIGELVDTAQRVFDPSETRLLVSHASPGREGLLSQLALVLKADLTVSAGLHFRYASSYNEFSVQPDFAGFRHKLTLAKEAFDKVWDSVKGQVDAVIDDNQRVLLDKALSVVERIPPALPSSGPGAAAAGEEPAWKNCWNWNLCDAAYGSLVLDVKDGRVSAELKSQGFNFAYRRSATVPATPAAPAAPSLPAQAAPQVKTPPAPSSPVQKQQPNGTPADPKKPQPAPKSKKDKKDKTNPSTPDPVEPDAAPAAPEPAPTPAPAAAPVSGARTPKTGKPPRHPWTIFMRMAPHIQVTEADIREFYNEAKAGITRVNLPHPFAGKARLAYVEFGDEEAMKLGLEKHAETLKDTTPDVKQATDRESRTAEHQNQQAFNNASAPNQSPTTQNANTNTNNTNTRGGFGGRGRGRGGPGGSGFAARGLSAAGLTRGGGRGGGQNQQGQQGGTTGNGDAGANKPSTGDTPSATATA
ncbi:hypothetical protein JR316_0005125 [Psilocybe cubensis]|uniref:DUF2433 domain-containing protein n=2 Tax=Psilocybe cubensis TaxID=181762 RepID=A0A8H8CK97_PSICU|nr:hypothetical protein JR316_0005125 [Psilocybe cubensis]KAH9483025.1 hypothetical protein JR316_0005125 [Psilocybe cubensis]